jgi:hypothetical protein
MWNSRDLYAWTPRWITAVETIAVRAPRSTYLCGERATHSSARLSHALLAEPCTPCVYVGQYDWEPDRCEFLKLGAVDRKKWELPTNDSKHGREFSPATALARAFVLKLRVW